MTMIRSFRMEEPWCNCWNTLQKHCMEIQYERKMNRLDALLQDWQENREVGGTLPGGARWHLTGNGHLTISGCGIMAARETWTDWYAAFDRSFKDTSMSQRFQSYKEKIKLLSSAITSVTVEEGITALGSSAFENCVNLRTISLPGSLEKMGTYCLKNTGIETIRIPDNVSRTDPLPNSLGFIMYGCKQLKSVRLPAHIRTLGAAFINCTALEEMDLPDQITSLSGTFDGCTALRRIKLPAGLTDIGRETFRNCSALEEVELPEGLLRVGEDAFRGCAALRRLVFPRTVEKIKCTLFGCTGLEEVVLPAKAQEQGIHFSRRDGMIIRTWEGEILS